jgi:hypothetical protein
MPGPHQYDPFGVSRSGRWRLLDGPKGTPGCPVAWMGLLGAFQTQRHVPQCRVLNWLAHIQPGTVGSPLRGFVRSELCLHPSEAGYLSAEAQSQPSRPHQELASFRDEGQTYYGYITIKTRAEIT